MTPTDAQMKFLKALALSESGIATYVNRNVAEECSDCRWIRVNNGGYELTAQGRKIIEIHGGADL